MPRQRRAPAAPMRRAPAAPAPARAPAAPAPAKAAAAPTQPVPTQAHPPAPMMSQPQQPGMFAQMATTAAGVAVGSAVGHTIGHALTGSFGGGSAEAAPAAAAPAAPPMQPQQQLSAPCQYELKQFLECAQNQHDISLCEGFNQVLKECRLQHGGGM
uniref:Coiled-coil-helix-coiled-coil-helix domain-containing protein 2 n=1 Tax=Rhipicephalus zambeziensis TaxID=60191 RepID=A0A224YCB6_9ACAR